jgi:hypothetical protein
MDVNAFFLSAQLVASGRFELSRATRFLVINIRPASVSCSSEVFSHPVAAKDKTI